MTDQQMPFKRFAASVNWIAEMWSDTENLHDHIALREAGVYDANHSHFIRQSPPNGVWAKLTQHGIETVLDQDKNLLLSILWFNGK